MTEETNKRNRILLIAAGLIALVLAGMWVFTTPDTGAEVTSRFATVTRGPMEVTVTGPGRVRAASAVEIGVPDRIRGTLQLVFLIEEGTVVEKGEVVAMLDTTDAVTELETALDELETVQAEYDQLLVDNANNIKDLENAVRSAELSFQQAELRLAAMEFSSELEKQQGRLDVEKARISRDEAKRKLEAQKIINEGERFQKSLELEGAREEVEETRAEMRALTIRAPGPGLVIHAEEGRFMERTKVKEGDQVRGRQELIELPDLSTLQVALTVNELDAQRVEVGQRAAVRLDAYPEVTFTGHVIDISTLAQELSDESNVKVFPAVVELDEPDERVRPGMTASATICVEQVQDALQVPLAALGTVDGSTYVKPVDVAEPVPVGVGQHTESTAQILEGVEEGERLELGWMQDPAVVLSQLAGRVDVPEAIVRRITRQGEQYGQAAGSRTTVRAEDQEGQRTGRQGRERMQSLDPGQLTPEMRQRIEQMRAQRSTEGGTERGAFRSSGMDSLISARTLETLEAHKEALPQALKDEAQGYIDAGKVELRNISSALQDSLRAWRMRDRPAGRIPPPDPGQDADGGTVG